MIGIRELPEEVLLIIVNYLDLPSLENLYRSCTFLRYIVCLQGAVRHCRMSLNTLATAETLKSNFFRDICVNLQELNLRGVRNLSKTSMLHAAKRLKNLRILDVSYTNIVLSDLLQIYEVCTTIKEVSINFIVGKQNDGLTTKEDVQKYQNLFQNFQRVHFVGGIDLWCTKSNFIVLHKAKLDNLKLTISKCLPSASYFESDNIYEPYNVFMNMAEFNLFSLNWNTPYSAFHIYCSKTILSFVNSTDYEFIMVISLKDTKVLASPLMTNFVYDHLNIQAETFTNFSDIEVPKHNVAIMVWNKRHIEFNEHFFINLKRRINPLFTWHIPPEYKNSVLPLSYDSYTITPSGVHEQRVSASHENICKKRKVVPNLLLDYDELFEEKEELKLRFSFTSLVRNPVTISQSSQYLRKITFLCLNGFVKYSEEFWNILFRCCEKLTTLSVIANAISPIALSISRSIPLSSSIKNLRIEDKRVDFTRLFSSLSQCKTLENVLIYDCSTENLTLPSPLFVFETCNNLYSFVVHMANRNCDRKAAKILSSAQKKCGKHYLNISNYNSGPNAYLQYYYDPFVEVFNVSTIKEI